MRDLIVQYEYALSLLRKEDKRLKDKQSYLQVKIKKVTDMEKLNLLDEELALVKTSRSQISEMSGELQDDIQHMKTGRRPGSRRGAENLAAYQREICFDPNSFLLHTPKETIQGKTDEEITMLENKVEDLLYFLSKKERDVYILAKGYGFSAQEIAELAGMAHGTVKGLLDRAQKKIIKYIKKDSF
ncbi:sigma factor-like helix-turn-helix DNA-binding protein [Priestia aryabhattai]|uniref:sigma factor-like helix-turn-helix DNA-binding protein n=1 Tax=Priestia aryabhattai TaxID=412384 RepID=UPI0023B0616F|nr:sigma factor-like helix-turn-helix DNA-binding protein [Priestia aryabhattai]MDE8676469.1 sigma factor-like helix-turn-helix DNA-binding protein [Priestia aryabhattai]